MLTVFPTNQSAMKVVYLAITAASKESTMPLRNWKLAFNRFTIEFGERVTAYL
jgi:transposase-like protein